MCRDLGRCVAKQHHWLLGAMVLTKSAVDRRSLDWASPRWGNPASTNPRIPWSMRDLFSNRAGVHRACFKESRGLCTRIYILCKKRVERLPALMIDVTVGPGPSKSCLLHGFSLGTPPALSTANSQNTILFPPGRQSIVRYDLPFCCCTIIEPDQKKMSSLRLLCGLSCLKPCPAFFVRLIPGKIVWADAELSVAVSQQKKSL